MIPISKQLRNAARFGSPIAPGEREKAAMAIDNLVEALRDEIEIDSRPRSHEEANAVRQRTIDLLRELVEEA